MLLLAACQSPATENHDGYLELEQEKSSSNLLARFYLGGIYEPPTDPRATGLLVDSTEALLINIGKLNEMDSVLSRQLQSSSRNGRLSWDNFEETVSRLYYEHRRMPQTVDELTQTYWKDSTFFEVEVDGVMSVARRKVLVPEMNLRQALVKYQENDDRIIYGDGTLILGEHWLDGGIVEYTAMIKRPDGFWDFAAYDETGGRVDSTTTEPKALAVPTQCTGCHFGSRLYEPEKSFPADAPIGPHGPQQIIVEGDLPSANLVRTLDEHRKRSDYVLGVYGTMYLLQKGVNGANSDSVLVRLLSDLVQP